MPITIEGQTWTVGEFTLVEGQQVSGPQLDALPPGSVVKEPGSRGLEWTKSNENYASWTADGGRGPQTLSPGFNLLVSVGGQETGPETLAAYKIRFARHVLAAAARWDSVNMTVVRRTLDRLGCHDPGPTVAVGSTVAPSTVAPDGTVAIYGEPGESHFTIFTRTDGQWVKTSGRYHSLNDVGAAVVVTVPATEGDEITDHEEERIAEFKRQVWNEGWRTRQDEQWCGTYEQILFGVGITSALVHPFDEYPHTRRRALGVDALILAVDGHDWSMWTKRERAWTFVSGDDLMIRPRADATVAVLYDGTGAMSEPMTPWLMNNLPVGAEMTNPDKQPSLWRKIEDKEGQGYWARIYRSGRVGRPCRGSRFKQPNLRLTSLTPTDAPCRFVDDDEEAEAGAS